MLTRLLLLAFLIPVVYAQTPPPAVKRASAVQKPATPAIPTPSVQAFTIPQPFVMKSEGGPQPSPWTTWGPFAASGVTVLVSLGTVWITQRNSRRMLEQQNAHSLTVLTEQKQREYEMWNKQRRWEAKRDTYRELCVTVYEIESSLVRQKMYHESLGLFMRDTDSYTKVMDDFKNELLRREQSKREFRVAAAFSPFDVSAETVVVLARVREQLSITDRATNLDDAEVDALKHSLKECRETLLQLATEECGREIDRPRLA